MRNETNESSSIVRKVNEKELKNRFLKLANNVNQKNFKFHNEKIMLGHDSGNYKNFAYSIDSFFRLTHFPQGMNNFDIGYKSIIASLSDLISSGSIPKGVLISFLIPEEISEKELLEIYNGISRACLEHKVCIVGGDTKKCKDLGLVISCFGNLLNKGLITRFSAKAGDIIYSTNLVGRAAIGLDSLLNKKFLPFDIYKKFSKSYILKCKQNFLKPKIDSKYAKLIAKFATSACDVSDGFFFSLSMLTMNNGIEINDLPVDSTIKKRLKFAEIKKLLEIGEDYCVLFSVPSDKEKEFLKYIGGNKLFVYRIGRITKEKASEKKFIKIRFKNKDYYISKREVIGYDSFSQ
ncbi:MAG: thiamine-phosphate kinase [Candidatus Aenigmatarchaeota archaeon]